MATRTVLAAIVVALAVPAVASAHAQFVRSVPANGASLLRAPTEVRVVFDDGVSVNARTAVVSNTSRRSVTGARAHTAGEGRTLVIPLRALPDGDYSVRWSVDTDDGHREEGTLAFGVGPGHTGGLSVLVAKQQLTWQDAFSRTLWFVGVLLVAGLTLFGLVARRTLSEERLRGPQMQALFAAFLLAFFGGSAIVHTAPDGTRNSYVLQVALVVALVGGAAAALAPVYPRSRFVAWSAGVALLPAPTLAGHALDADQPRALAAIADLAHIGAAAVWFGGIVALVWSVPRATDDDALRSAVARRFSRVAFVAVLVLAATGLARALTELRAFHQVWSTGYGRALIAKTAIFVVLIAIGWLSRAVLLAVFARLRRSLRVEMVLVVGVVVAVGILTDLRPGTAAPKTAAAVPPAAAPAVLPAPGGVVAARELGTLAVGASRRAGELTVTVLDGMNSGPRGLDVRVDGVAARACGPGCYRVASTALRPLVSIGSASTRFELPANAPAAGALLARAARAYRGANTFVLDERLASSPRNAQTTRFRIHAPDRLAYAIRGGPQAIVIGGRRWDRDTAHGRWVRSPQNPISVTQTLWRRARNVRLVAPHTLTFLDPTPPAWFRLELDPRTSMPRRLQMIAAAHFMTERYSRFGSPVAISPPISR